MHFRSLVRLAASLGLVLALGACADDTTSPPLTSTLSTDASAGGAPVRLMSRNMYLGADIDHVLFDPVNGPDIAWYEINRTNYPERAARLAAEIVEHRPHLVGLQEVTRYTLIDPTTFTPIMRVDWLDILMAYLAPHGYRVVSRATNFQTYLPMGGNLVHYLDGDAIIASADVTVHEDDWKHFDVQVNLDDYLPGLGRNFRSYQWADVTVNGSRFLFVNVHLEVQGWKEVQVEQTAELLEFVNGKAMPTFMVGDFNSAANSDAPERAKTATYGMVLAAGFDDLWLRGNGRFTTSGPTCCQASDLSNAVSELDERIDFIFARNTPSAKGYAGGANVRIFGNDPSSRFVTTHGYYLWPSDHAGLFGELWLPPGLMK